MKFWQTEKWMEYLLNSKFDANYIDHSFYHRGKFVPLIQDGYELYSPGFEDNKEILMRIDQIASENSIKRMQVDSQIKSYLNISGYTCVIDPFNITPTKGHKSAIKKGQKYLESETLTETLQFMHDYYEIAGKQTRPSHTFMILQDWIQRGYGTLLKATYQGETAGYIYILHYEGQAYYFMSGVFPEYKQYCVTHYLQSVAFEMLRDQGVHYYELGEQIYNSLYYQPSDKEQNISKFKRNFGGDIVVKPRSEYFFDKQYFYETIQDRASQYWECEHKNV